MGLYQTKKVFPQQRKPSTIKTQTNGMGEHIHQQI